MRRFALLSFIFIRNCLMLTSLLVSWAAVTLAQRISPTNVPTVVNSWSPVQLKFTLKRDPAAINLDVPDMGISAKARKEVKRGVSELKSNNLKEAEKQLGAAYKSDPSSSDVNFLLGYLYYEKSDYGRAAEYLSAASKAFAPGRRCPT
jgi:hypothetical protein